MILNSHLCNRRPCFFSGADFLLDASGRPWLCELNRSPRQKPQDYPMLHALLDLVFGEGGERSGIQSAGDAAASASVAPSAQVTARGNHCWQRLSTDATTSTQKQAAAAAAGSIEEEDEAALSWVPGWPEPDDSDYFSTAPLKDTGLAQCKE